MGYCNAYSYCIIPDQDFCHSAESNCFKELHIEPIFSWSKHSGWALLKLEARSAVGFLSV